MTDFGIYLCDKVMNMTQFRTIEKKVCITCVLFSVICAITFSLVKGISSAFFIGIALGTVLMLLNFHLLGIVVSRFFDRSGMGIPVMLYVLRLLIYAAGAVFCFRVGMTCLLAYALGVLGLVAGADRKSVV